jgi:hypothetical protein
LLPGGNRFGGIPKTGKGNTHPQINLCANRGGSSPPYRSCRLSHRSRATALSAKVIKNRIPLPFRPPILYTDSSAGKLRDGGTHLKCENTLFSSRATKQSGAAKKRRKGHAKILASDSRTLRKLICVYIPKNIIFPAINTLFHNKSRTILRRFVLLASWLLHFPPSVHLDQFFLFVIKAYHARILLTLIQSYSRSLLSPFGHCETNMMRHFRKVTASVALLFLRKEGIVESFIQTSTGVLALHTRHVCAPSIQ